MMLASNVLLKKTSRCPALRALWTCTWQRPLVSQRSNPVYLHLNLAARRFTVSDKATRFDPTAKRPTQKCDPYGLSGQSLSYQECINQLSTLEEGWKLKNADHGATEEESPTFLEKQFYHDTFYTASRFMSQISLLCTNLNHYPQLSIERLLVDDVTKFYNTQKAADISDNLKKRKIKGWVFVSTIRCSTYRPPTKKEDTGALEKGLTYHDFHLAMSVDVEANREEMGQLLLQFDE
jgi:pterin-4a-carbinolamine dehydratase